LVLSKGLSLLIELQLLKITYDQSHVITVTMSHTHTKCCSAYKESNLKMEISREFVSDRLCKILESLQKHADIHTCIHTRIHTHINTQYCRYIHSRPMFVAVKNRNNNESSCNWTGLDWFFLIPEGRRPKPATPLHAMLFCPVQFSCTQPLVVQSSSLMSSVQHLRGLPRFLVPAIRP